MEHIKLAEKKLASYIGVKHALLTGMGRTAIVVALKALGIDLGDEVIVPSFTCDTVIKAVEFCGAKPVFADVDSLTFNVNPQQVEDNVTRKTKVILVIHCYGQPADIDQIVEIAVKHGIPVIEDAAHALGAEYHKRKVGGFGDLSIFSFRKNMGCSSGGSLATNSDDLMSKAKDILDTLSAEENIVGRFRCLTTRRLLGFGRKHRCVRALSSFRLLGMARKLAHSTTNSVPESFSADNQIAVEAIKSLRSIDPRNQERRRKAQFLTNLINSLKIDCVTPPFEDEDRTHVYYPYGLKANKRREVLGKLRKTEKYKFWSLPWQCPYGDNAKKLSRHLILLHMNPDINKRVLQSIVSTLASTSRNQPAFASG